MAIEIRPPAEDELRPAMTAAEVAFGSGTVEDEDWERERKALPASRALAAFDGGRPVALAGAYAFDLTIPGGALPCAGVTWVGVMPTHRRRGIRRSGRGSVRLVDAEEALQVFPPLYERVRAGRAGMLSRDERWWKEHRLADPDGWRRGASRKFYAAVEVDGSIEGYAYYRIKDEWDEGFAKGEVRVIEAMATSVDAHRTLWGFLHGIDLVARVVIVGFDPGSPLPLLVQDPRALNLRVGDGLWLRFVDLEAALQARSYKPGESVVLEVTDELCPWNAGRYRVGDDAGRTEDTADLALDVADLASAYLGNHDFHALVRAGLAEQRVDGAAEAATLLFRTDLPPYCPEVF